MRLTPQLATVERKLIDDHLASTDKQGGVAARRAWIVNAKPVGNNFCGVRRRRMALLFSPELSTGPKQLGVQFRFMPDHWFR
jgi:hypothetical protein